MKKLLLGSTALVAMGLLATPALAAEMVKVSVNGEFLVLWGFALDDQDDAVGQPGEDKRSHGAYQNSKLKFGGSTTLDNGITVGVNIDLAGQSQDNNVDKSWAYFDGTFGKIEVGSVDGVAFKSTAWLPSAYHYQGPNYGSVIWGENNNGGGFSPQSITGAWTYGGVAFGNDNEKVNYFTPRISGFQLGASYTPEACELENSQQGQDCGYPGYWSGDSNNASASFRQSEVWELGVNYAGDIGDASIGFSIGYIDGQSENSAATFEDRDEISVNGSVGFGAFTVGAGFRNDNQGLAGNNTDTSVWALSGSYGMGAWTFGAGLINVESEAGAAGGQDELSVFAAGVNYDIGPGILLTAGVDSADYEDNLNNPAGENSWTSLTVGSRIWF
jgi:outer membrane protein OmpU